jgi:peptide/nickel transport system permease protein
MIRYVIRRLLYAIPTLLGVMLLTFVLFYVAVSPEQLARRNLSTKNPTHAQIEQWKVDHGYDKPPMQQFENHMENLLLFRLGKSDRTKEDILTRIKVGAGPSAELATMILITSVVVSLTLAMAGAYFRGTYVDRALTIMCVVLMSIVYVVYVMSMQFLLGKLLKYGPIEGFQPGLPSIRFLAIPVVIGVLAKVGSDIRLYRTFLLDEMNQDYVRTARAKGVRERQVLFKHVLKNAMIPVITTTVSIIPSLILGSIVLESFFGIPGIGSYLQQAISNNDFAVVRANVYLGALLYIFGLILTDLCYAAVDARVRFE